MRDKYLEIITTKHREQDMTKQRLSKLISYYNNDSVVLGLIESSIKACSRYVVAVNDLELYLLIQGSTAEGQEYRDTVSSLDRNRSFTHNSLISDVTAMNRLCVKAGIDTVFKGNVANRIEVAEFAKEIVTELFEKRRL